MHGRNLYLIDVQDDREFTAGGRGPLEQALKVRQQGHKLCSRFCANYCGEWKEIGIRPTPGVCLRSEILCLIMFVARFPPECTQCDGQLTRSPPLCQSKHDASKLKLYSEANGRTKSEKAAGRSVDCLCTKNKKQSGNVSLE